MATTSGEECSNITERAKIYKNPKTDYEVAVNDAAVQLALENPTSLLERGKL